MRADLAPFAADGLLLLAGLGGLWACGLIPRRGGALLPALGLAYLVGTALVSLALIALLAIGFPFTLVTFALVVLACVAVGVAIDRRRARRTDPSSQDSPPHVPWRQPREWSSDRWLVAGFVVVLGGYALLGLLSAVVMPLDQWDAWTMWARKAVMLTQYDALMSGFFAAPSYEFSHQDYPLLYPVWQAIHFRAAGEIDTQAIHGHIWLLFVAFVWAAAYLVRDVARPIVWAPVLLAVAVAPGVWTQLLSANADIPLAIYGALGALAMARWLAEGRRADLVLAAILLAATASVKNEGLALTGAILAAAGIVVVFSNRRALVAYLAAAVAVVVAILPWQIWLAAHDVAGDMPVSEGLQPGYLIDRSERVQPAVTAINQQIADQGMWLYMLPLAVLAVVACLVAGVGRRVAAFYLASGLIAWLTLVWSYTISQLDIGWHLSTSVNRVVSGLMFLCIAAVLHLTGLLAASGPTPRSRVSGAKRSSD
jgi:hypothetical protein